ncbi:DUF1266 domain-containing protein [Streptomyces sp. NPDC046909]|uniref:DUF1266 domain-containing protein n=1 Tax=Streptomyces sp. NPDC046909 TaxID=3155617 RepID=UPI0033F645EC
MGLWSIRRWTKKKAASGQKVSKRYPVPLTTHQLWMVSLSAPVSRGRDASRTTLYPFTRLDDDRARSWLAEQWEITSRDELADRLDDLARSGYRARAQQLLGVSPLAWDAALYVDISRRGFASGLITEGEAWTALKNIVPAVVSAYASWQEYADHYLLGRKVWRERLVGTPDIPAQSTPAQSTPAQSTPAQSTPAQSTPAQSTPAPQSTADAHLRALLDPANRASPWNLAPWDTISRPDRAR